MNYSTNKIIQHNFNYKIIRRTYNSQYTVVIIKLTSDCAWNNYVWHSIITVWCWQRWTALVGWWRCPIVAVDVVVLNLNYWNNVVADVAVVVDDEYSYHLVAPQYCYDNQINYYIVWSTAPFCCWWLPREKWKKKIKYTLKYCVAKRIFVLLFSIHGWWWCNWLSIEITRDTCWEYQYCANIKLIYSSQLIIYLETFQIS